MQACRENGLTLVEVLVVLAIIGVMSSIAVLGLGGSGRGVGVQAEAQRLASSIQLAADEAIVTDRKLALMWDGEGYSFVHWSSQANAWQDNEAAGLGGRHDLPDRVSLTGNKPSPARIGENDALELTLSGDSESWSIRFDGLNATTAQATDG